MRLHHTHRDEHGVVAVETVLVLPFLLAILLAIATFGSYSANRTQLSGAARDAARSYALGKDPTYPAGLTGFASSGTHKCAAAEMAAGTPDGTVTLTKTYDFDLPLIGFSKTVTESARMRCGA